MEKIFRYRVFKKMNVKEMEKQGYELKWELYYSSNNQACCFDAVKSIDLNLYDVKIVDSKIK